MSLVERQVGVLGATSLVGQLLLTHLVKEGYRVTAYSRQAFADCHGVVTWRQLPSGPFSPTSGPLSEQSISLWVCAAPIWVLPSHFSLLESYGVQRIVALSSTSRFTKDGSLDLGEQEVARRLAEGEAEVQAWAEKHNVEWVILRPTLIYGLGRDKNIAEIARFIRRVGCFPVLGAAKGLRQPIHADDVAAACVTALSNPQAPGRSYNISGGETISYREMVTRVFAAMGRPARLVAVPRWLFCFGLILLRMIPRHRLWTMEMVDRMNRDLVFDCTEALRDLSFQPRPFHLTAEDVAV